MALGRGSRNADGRARRGIDRRDLPRERSALLHRRAADALIAAGPARATTVVFADLVGFTTLAEVHGDRVALALLDEFAVLVGQLVRQFGLAQVKAIGDGFLLTAAEPSAALAFARQVLAEMGGRDRQLGVRLGIHAGPVVERDGDVFGRTVNLAARVLAQASDGEAVVTGDALKETMVPEGFHIAFLGRRRLRGIPGAVELNALRLAAAPVRATDPICRMKLDPDSALTAAAAGCEIFYFCSETCRWYFLEASGAGGSKAGRGSCPVSRRGKKKRRSGSRRVAFEWR